MNSRAAIVAHDYQCPWSYLAFFQARRLQKDFPKITFDWQSYELLPTGPAEAAKRPAASDRFKALAIQDNLPLPRHWPKIVVSHNALEGAEYAKDQEPEHFDWYNEAVYRAFWEVGADISDRKVLETIGTEAGLETSRLLTAITNKRYAAKIIPFNEPAYATGIRRVTTFNFIDEQCAEAPQSTIRDMASRFVARYV